MEVSVVVWDRKFYDAKRTKISMRGDGKRVDWCGILPEIPDCYLSIFHLKLFSEYLFRSLNSFESVWNRDPLPRRPIKPKRTIFTAFLFVLVLGYYSLCHVVVFFWLPSLNQQHHRTYEKHVKVDEYEKRSCEHSSIFCVLWSMLMYLKELHG